MRKKAFSAYKEKAEQERSSGIERLILRQKKGLFNNLHYRNVLNVLKL